MVNSDDTESTFDTRSEGESSTITFTPSLEAAWTKIVRGRPMQAVNEAYGWPSDEIHTTIETVWHQWKIAYFGDLVPKTVLKNVNRLLSVPGARFLDIGCGKRACWLASMGDIYPLAEGVGVDSQACTEEILPPNVISELYDVSDGLPYPDGFFDVVHHSFLGPSLSDDFSYTTLCEEIGRVLKPGGFYIAYEIINHDAVLPESEGVELSDVFPATALLGKSQRALSHIEGVKSFSDGNDFFAPTIDATNLFSSVNENIVYPQFGARGVDARVDEVGQILLRVCDPLRQGWFFDNAGLDASEVEFWLARLKEEVASIKMCKPGTGIVGRAHEIWARRGENEVERE